MLHDALYYLMLFVIGGIGILVFGMIITVVVTVGSEVTARNSSLQAYWLPNMRPLDAP